MSKKPNNIPSKARYYMGFAKLAATRSKDETQVGAVLLGPDGEVRLTGYNGPPVGVEDLPERFERPMKYLFASHAEQNIIAFAAREGISTKGCTLYVTHLPCSGCMKSVIQSGIVNVVFDTGTTSMPEAEFEASMTMAREAGVCMTTLDKLMESTS
jgi:dCMP deaminase